MKQILVFLILIVTITQIYSFTAIDAQNYEACWQNLFKNASMCPSVAECLQDTNCANSLHQDYVCSIDCNKLNYSGPGNLTSQASDPSCGHNCDSQFVPENFTSKAKYFAVIACYSQCYDILEPQQPQYNAIDAQKYEACWTTLFMQNTTCAAIPKCYADTECKGALYQDFTCSKDCNMLNFTGPDGFIAQAADPQCGHSCDIDNAPTNYSSHALYWSVIDCYAGCYKILEPVQPKYNALKAQKYEECWGTLFSSKTPCSSLKSCMSNTLCREAINNDYQCSIACNKLTFDGPGTFTFEASDPLCGHSCDQQSAPTDATALSLWNEVMQCYDNCYDILATTTTFEA